MAKGTTLLGWLGTGAGITLVYAAFKNETPSSVVSKALGLKASTSTIQSFNPMQSPGFADSATGASNDASRPAYLQQGLIKPQLVTFGHGAMTLDISAAESFKRVEAAYGKTIPLSGASRTMFAQALGYASNPSRFAKPTNKPPYPLHTVGLAVDVSQNLPDLNDPKLVAAFTNNGWYRAGKSGNWGKYGYGHEPWHWSYGVAG